MKKLYFLSLISLTTVASFGQIFQEEFNYPDSAVLTANGWTAQTSGAGSQAVDVGISNGLTYVGYSTVGSNAARLDNTGEDVYKTFTPSVTSGSLYFSFLVNVTSGDAGYFTHLLVSGTTWVARVFVRPSATTGKINFGISNSGTASFATSATDYDLNTTYLIIVKYDVSTTGAVSLWVKSSGVPASEAAAGIPEHTTSGSGNATISGVGLRQYSATQNITVDAIKVYQTWFGTAGCPLALGTEVSTCDAITIALDTYNISIPYTGGGAGTYTLSSNAGTVSGSNPNTTAAGNITITGITEGTSVTLTVSGSCAFTKIMNAPECKPINTLPYYEGFTYPAAAALGTSQLWTGVNSGDEIVAQTGSLVYSGTPGVTTSGNSITFGGTGKEAFTPFTATTSGTLYTEFLMSVTDVTAVTDLTGTTYIAGLTDGTNGGYKARLFTKRIGAGYVLGLDSAATTTNYETTVRNVGDVLRIVLAYNFTGNSIALWVNPASSGSTPTLASIPAAPITSLGGFILRQDAGNTTPVISFDELKFTTSLTDLQGLVSLTANQFNEIAGLKVYPNPVSNGKLFITTDNANEKTVAVYDILGKQVIQQVVTNEAVNVAALNAGIYIVKITEDGKTATRKLVVR
jgi:Secretion system C-terminal sorting domain